MITAKKEAIEITQPNTQVIVPADLSERIDIDYVLTIDAPQTQAISNTMEAAREPTIALRPYFARFRPVPMVPAWFDYGRVGPTPCCKDC